MKQILLLCPILPILLLEAYDIQLTPVKNPILPVQLGDAKFVYTKHTFLYYIDLLPIINQLNNIHNYYNIVKQHLEKTHKVNPISYQGLIENYLLRAEYLINNTQNKVSNLYPHIRTKRGLINLIGKAHKWLYGTLDADDGERYDNAIDDLQKNQKNIIKELNLQISLSKNLINNYNETVTTFQLNQKKLQRSLEIFEAAVENKISNLNNFIIFQSLLVQINLDCQNLINFVDNLEDAIMFSKLNALHDSIISSRELNEMLSYLRTIYKENEIPTFKNILNYYQFLGTQVTFSKTKIIFAIHVPIIKPQTYILYHLFPVIQNSHMIIPKYPYMARAGKEVQFEENDCPSLEETYYCNEAVHPPEDCTTRVLDGSKSNNCQIFEVSFEETIVEPITAEEILIIPRKEARILAQCKMDQYIDLKEPTLVKIPKSCQIQVGAKKFTSDVKSHFGKPLILPELKLANLTTNFKVLKTQNLTSINLQEISKLKNMVNQLTPVEEVIDKSIGHQSIILFGILTFLSIATLAFLIMKKDYIIKLLCMKKKPSSKPEDTIENTGIF